MSKKWGVWKTPNSKVSFYGLDMIYIVECEFGKPLISFSISYVIYGLELLPLKN